MVEIIHEPIIPGVELGDFESIKQVSENGTEFWSARDLQVVAGYQQWRRFEEAVERAMTSARNQGIVPTDHFVSAGKMIETGKGARREVDDYHITRYGCYLVFQNGDPRKPEIAAAQGYFAVRTREAELNPAPAELPVPSSMSEALRLAADQWERREIAEARAESAERVVTAVENNDGLTVREFHKHYFPDVRETDFNAILYSLGLLLDQRGQRRDKDGSPKPGKQHRHPAYAGKAYFYLHGSMDRFDNRWESVRVRPGTPEVELRDLLISKGLPAPASKGLVA